MTIIFWQNILKPLHLFIFGYELIDLLLYNYLHSFCALVNFPLRGCVMFPFMLFPSSLRWHLHSHIHPLGTQRCVDVPPWGDLLAGHPPVGRAKIELWPAILSLLRQFLATGRPDVASSLLQSVDFVLCKAIAALPLGDLVNLAAGFGEC